MVKKITPTVEEFMDALDHPLKELCQEIRAVIKNTNPKIQERIKWNAPSYFVNKDFLTMNFTRKEYILLIFHHPIIDHFESPLFEAKPKGRAMIHIYSDVDFATKRSALKNLIMNILAAMDDSRYAS